MVKQPISAPEEVDQRSPASSECGHHGDVRGRSRDGGLHGSLRLCASGLLEEDISMRFAFSVRG